MIIIRLTFHKILLYLENKITFFNIKMDEFDLSVLNISGEAAS